MKTVGVLGAGTAPVAGLAGRKATPTREQTVIRPTTTANELPPPAVPRGLCQKATAVNGILQALQDWLLS